MKTPEYKLKQVRAYIDLVRKGEINETYVPGWSDAVKTVIDSIERIIAD